MRQEERIRRILWAQQEYQKAKLAEAKLAEESVQPPVEKQTARIMAKNNVDDLVVDVIKVGEIVPLKEEQSVQDEPATLSKTNKKKSVK